MAGRRRKHRTHQVDEETTQKLPKSFVFKRGHVGKVVRGLLDNVRETMEPNTARSLHERKSNNIRDFVHVAGPLGVTHFLVFNSTLHGTNLRIVRVPHGPTLYFRVDRFMLMRDVAQQVPLAQPAAHLEFLTAPLVVLHGFAPDNKVHQLMSVTLQNMFPPINIQKLKVSSCRRVVLFEMDPATDTIEFRQFAIHVAPAGLSKSVKRLVQGRVPDLSNVDDIADYVLSGTQGSESDAEDGGANQVDMGVLQRGNAKLATSRNAVRLREVLIKIEEGLAQGAVLYHRFVSKTAEEVAELERSAKRREREREKRRKEQEDNIKRKAKDKEAEAKRQQRKKLADMKKPGLSDAEDEDAAESNGAGDDGDDEDDDADFKWHLRAAKASSTQAQRPSPASSDDEGANVDAAAASVSQSGRPNHFRAGEQPRAKRTGGGNGSRAAGSSSEREGRGKKASAPGGTKRAARDGGDKRTKRVHAA